VLLLLLSLSLFALVSYFALLICYSAIQPQVCVIKLSDSVSSHSVATVLADPVVWYDTNECWVARLCCVQKRRVTQKRSNKDDNTSVEHSQPRRVVSFTYLLTYLLVGVMGHCRHRSLPSSVTDDVMGHWCHWSLTTWITVVIGHWRHGSLPSSVT